MTTEQLEKLGACESEIEGFKEIFGDKAYISRRNFYKALEAGLDISWLGFAFPQFMKSNEARPILVEYSKNNLPVLKALIRRSPLSKYKKTRAVKGLNRLAEEGRLLSQDFGDSFPWEDTPEGFWFWAEISRNL